MQKTSIAWLLSLTAVFPAAAISDAELDTSCKKAGDLAYILMVTRQSGTMSMSYMMETFEAEPLAHNMIINAFEMPHLVSGEVAFQAAADFRDQWTLKCYQGDLD